MAASLSRKFDPIVFHARFRPLATACVDLATGEAEAYRRLYRNRVTALRLPRILAKRIEDGARSARIAHRLAQQRFRGAIISAASRRAGGSDLRAAQLARLTAARTGRTSRATAEPARGAWPRLNSKRRLAQPCSLPAANAPLAAPVDVARSRCACLAGVTRGNSALARSSAPDASCSTPPAPRGAPRASSSHARERDLRIAEFRRRRLARQASRGAAVRFADVPYGRPVRHHAHGAVRRRTAAYCSPIGSFRRPR